MDVKIAASEVFLDKMLSVVVLKMLWWRIEIEDRW
jgi:hypothetical protein